MAFHLQSVIHPAEAQPSSRSVTALKDLDPNALSLSCASLNKTVVLSGSSWHYAGFSFLSSYSFLTPVLKRKRGHAAQAPETALVMALSDCACLAYKSRRIKVSSRGINVSVTLKCSTQHWLSCGIRV